MAIATSVQDCLVREGVHYDMIAHERTRDSNHTAQAAHIPGGRLAKCVMLEDDKGYLMAVIPASHKVDLGAVHRQLNRALGLATDRELVELFKDCEPGALPPLGLAYGIDSIS
jgi:Ala-tRNA(Pro) deacylase